MSERDPRIDPREGDVVKNRFGTYYVTGRTDDVVYYTDAPPPKDFEWTIEDWIKYAAEDQVVERGR